MSEVQETKITYDPSKPYKWEPTDEFKLSGTEFAFTYNVLMVEKQKLLRQLELINLFESKLRNAVETGVAKEQAEPVKGEVVEDKIVPVAEG
jgi:hypothetical protein